MVFQVEVLCFLSFTCQTLFRIDNKNDNWLEDFLSAGKYGDLFSLPLVEKDEGEGESSKLFFFFFFFFFLLNSKADNGNNCIQDFHQNGDHIKTIESGDLFKPSWCLHGWQGKDYCLRR